MPPHLHPRSAATSTLFAGTLVASFVVIAVPHIWPCPRPKKAYLDSEIIFDDQGRPMRRVRKVKKAADSDQSEQKIEAQSVTAKSQSQKGNTIQDEAKILHQLQAEAEAMDAENARRPCPVPKPKGALGRLLGFEERPDQP